MSRRFPTGIKFSVAAIVAVAATVVAIRIQTVRLHRPRHPIQYDDFEFAALGAQRLDLRRAPTPEGRALYAVEIRTVDRAIRVDLDFSPAIVTACDEGVHPFTYRPDAQLVWDADHGRAFGTPKRLAAGESYTATLIFEGMAYARRVHVRFSTGGPVGDFLDTLLQGREEIMCVVG